MQKFGNLSIMVEAGYLFSELRESISGDEFIVRVKYPEFNEQGQLMLPIWVGGSEGISESLIPISADYLRQLLNIQND